VDSLGVGMAVLAFSIAHIDSADFEIIVHILKSPRRHFFQQRFHVRNEQWFGFIDNDGHGRVQALDINYTIFNASLFDFLLDFFGNVDEIQSRGGFHLDNVMDNFHLPC